jgi:uncharacterized membrane protein YdjX (TVP38/TMEM64 family)
MNSTFKLISVYVSFSAIIYFLSGTNIYDYFLTFLNDESFGFVVVFLLAVDFFLSIPTLPLSLLTGHTLGALPSFLYVSLGLLCAGNLGYVMGRLFGEKVLSFVLGSKKTKFEKQFKKNAIPMILLSRAIPMFPEACALLSGSTKLPYKKFLLAWSLNTLPYAVYTSWIGSLSSTYSMWILILGISIFYIVSSVISFYYFKLKVG